MPSSDIHHHDWQAQPALSSSNRSIRKRLEADARHRYPALVRHMQSRRVKNHAARRRLSWQDRTLLVSASP